MFHQLKVMNDHPGSNAAALALCEMMIPLRWREMGKVAILPSLGKALLILLAAVPAVLAALGLWSTPRSAKVLRTGKTPSEASVACAFLSVEKEQDFFLLSERPST